MQNFAARRQRNNEFRVKDWLHGIRATEPEQSSSGSLTSQPLTQAERYRLVYHMLTNSREEGGAGITPKEGQWKNVETIFPLHDQTFNKDWIKKWATTTLLKAEDFDEIRDHLGEKVSCAMESKALANRMRSSHFILLSHSLTLLP